MVDLSFQTDTAPTGTDQGERYLEHTLLTVPFETAVEYSDKLSEKSFARGGCDVLLERSLSRVSTGYWKGKEGE